MLCIVRQVHVSSKTIIIIIIIVITKPLAETDGAGLTTHHVNSAECAAYHQFYSLRDRWRRYRRYLLLRNTNHHWWQWHCHNGCCRTETLVPRCRTWQKLYHFCSRYGQQCILSWNIFFFFVKETKKCTKNYFTVWQQNVNLLQFSGDDAFPATDRHS